MESIDINGVSFRISRIFTKNRNASARLREGAIIISLPSRWPEREKERVGTDLLKRAIAAIGKGRWNPQTNTKPRFFHGQKLKALGNEFELVFIQGKKFRGSTKQGKIEIRVPEHPQKNEKISKIVRREIVKSLMPVLKEKIEKINKSHFNSSVRRVSVRDTLTRWGSCSPQGDISLCFRLLFMPEDILDYVIVHELAHTKYRSHGPRFWALVEKVMPDHREKRKWLRENGGSVLADGKKTGQIEECGQKELTEFFEEPY